MCVSCGGKSEKLLPVPELVDLDMVREFVDKYNQQSLTDDYVMNTFDSIFKYESIKGNVKARQRAWDNMIQVYYKYTKNSNYFKDNKSNDIIIDDIVYSFNGTDYINMSNKYKKGMKKVMSKEELEKIISELYETKI